MIGAFVKQVAASLRPVQSLTLPIFPLGTVLFPGGSMSLKIFETRYLDMVKTCLKHGEPFGISLIREGQEVGAPAVPEAVGTVARIADWDMQQLGVLQVKVTGESRYRIKDSRVEAGLVIGEVELIEADEPWQGEALQVCAGFLKKVLPAVRPGEPAAEEHYEDASWVAFRVIELLPFGNPIKQKMLELTDAEMRLEILHRFLLDQKLIA